MNLPDAVMQYLRGDTALDVADQLAEPPQRIEAAMASAVPALLFALMQRISRPEGASAASQVIAQRDPAQLDHIPDLFRNEQIHALIADGARAATSFLRPDGFDATAAAVGQSCDMGFPSSRAILGLVTPVVLGVIGRHANPADAPGLARFFTGQVANINAAIPLPLRPHLDSIRNVCSSITPSGAAATASDDAMEGEAEIPRQENVPALHGPPIHRASGSVDRDGAAASWGVGALLLLALLIATWAVLPRHNNTAAPILRQNTPPAVQLAPQSVGQPLAQPAAAKLPASNPLSTNPSPP